MSNNAVHVLPELGYVRLKTVLAHVPICRTTWLAWVKEGRAPQPVKLGPMITAWKACEIRDFIEALDTREAA